MKPSATGSASYNRKKWSILFIGEDGKVVTVKHFKGIVTGLAMLLATLSVAVLVLYYQYQNRAGQVEALQKDMADQAMENRSLRDEKDQMLARLVILESELKAQREVKTPEGLGRAADSGEPSKMAGNEPAPPAAGPEKQPEKVQKAAGEKVANSQTPLPPISIANRNLVVCQDQISAHLRVEYKVMNTGAKDSPVVGRSVIILKGDNMNPEDWIVLPNVPLSDLKPSGEKGKRFRIYNFRTIKYKVDLSDVKGRLETATIFTFTDDGKLIMERDYPLETAAEMCP